MVEYLVLEKPQPPRIGGPPTNRFTLMSVDEIVAHVRGLYETKGISVLSYPEFRKQGNLYFHVYKKGLTLGAIVDRLGLRRDYNRYKHEHFVKKTANGIRRRWSWERVVNEARIVAAAHGFLPPAQWFQQNGKGSLVGFVYGLGKTWESLRGELESFEGSAFVQARNGLRWKSHPEASLSNFLYARGVRHKVGDKYPKGFCDISGLRRAWFDLHFLDRNGNWVDVEIWGDKPNGHGEENYARTRTLKEAFNRGNPRFLGIEHRDCFDEVRLSEILAPHIGLVEPHVFDRPTDRLIYTTHWSNSDELIETCRALAANQPGGVFPSEEWLRKRGKFRDRDGEPFNTLAIYVNKWLGGIRKLREILQQSDQSTIKWDRETALARYRDWHHKYGITVNQAKTRLQRTRLAPEDVLYAQNLAHALDVYVGGVRAANELLGIVPQRQTKWSREAVLSGYRRLFELYRMTPNQVTTLTPRRREAFGVSPDDVRLARKLVDRTKAFFTGAEEVYKLTGVSAVDVRTLEKAQR